MALANSWLRFAEKCADEPPLEFIHGMRLAAKRGVCCSVHHHPEIEIVYHPTGTGVTRLVGEADLIFAEGSVVVYAPGQPHDQVMDTPGEDYCVHIAVPRGKKNKLTSSFHVAAVNDPSLLDELRSLSVGRVRPDRSERTILNLRATATLCALIRLASSRTVSSATASPERHVHAAEQIIRDRFATIKSLGEVADHIGIGYDHLRHLFKQQRGRSLVHYLNEIRMERAKTLLAHSRLPLKQIATMCGFRDEYYFSAVFKRLVRLPPGKYRSQSG
jgi:AraC-like DNA-binding protein